MVMVFRRPRPAVSDVEPDQFDNVRRPRPIVDGRATWALLSAAVILGAWELCARTGVVDPAFTSYPSQVGRELVDYLSSSTGWSDLGYTAKEFCFGFLLAVLIGVPIGTVMGSVRQLDSALDALLNFVNASPLIAFAPLSCSGSGSASSRRSPSSSSSRSSRSSSAHEPAWPARTESC
jgi:ABC-type nitrate/sulfonate/bicarbonate transport system permease component